MSLCKSIDVSYELLLLLLGELLLVEVLDLYRARYATMPPAQRASIETASSSNLCIRIFFSWF
jgi:hypothetical protein